MARLQAQLACGVAGGLLFPLVFLVDDRVKTGYDPVRDSVSEAAIGPGGWVQIANFLVTGALMVVFAAGVRRAVSPWTSGLVAVFGAGLMLAGVFVTDPTPDGPTTWHGGVHNGVSLVVFGALTAACFTAARWRPARWWAWYGRLAGLAVPVLFLVSGAVTGTSGVWQRLSIAVGWTWLAVLGTRALRHPPADVGPSADVGSSAGPPVDVGPPADVGSSAARRQRSST